jgi:hypothetical protein
MVVEMWPEDRDRPSFKQARHAPIMIVMQVREDDCGKPQASFVECLDHWFRHARINHNGAAAVVH